MDLYVTFAIYFYIWLLRIDRIKYVSSLRIKNNRVNCLSDIRYFLKIIIFRLIILIFPFSENLSDIPRYEVENEKGMKLTDLTDERWPKKKPQNHPSTVSRVLKEITQSPFGDIFWWGNVCALSNFTWHVSSNFKSHSSIARYFI